MLKAVASFAKIVGTKLPQNKNMPPTRRLLFKPKTVVKRFLGSEWFLGRAFLGVGHRPLLGNSVAGLGTL